MVRSTHRCGWFAPRRWLRRRGASRGLETTVTPAPKVTRFRGPRPWGLGHLNQRGYFETLVSQPGRGEPTPVTSSQPLRTFRDESSLNVRTEYSSPPEAFSPFA